MAIRRRATIVDRDGVAGRLHHINIDPSHRAFAHVGLRDGSYVIVPFDLLEHEPNGGYRLPASWREYTRHLAGGKTIPLVEERVRVDKRSVPRQKLRVRRRVVSRPEVVETPVWRERIEVERVRVDRIVDEMPPARQEGDVLIVPCVDEEVVVEKRLRLREELRIRIVREQHIHRETVELRRHELEIESADQPEPIHPTKPGGD